LQEQLPLDAQHEWLTDVFSAYGKVAYVSLPKYRSSGKIKGFAFVEFDTPEEANKTLEVRICFPSYCN
jgi:La-related protein 7